MKKKFCVARSINFTAQNGKGAYIEAAIETEWKSEQNSDTTKTNKRKMFSHNLIYLTCI